AEGSVCWARTRRRGDGMRVIYQAENLIDAHLVKGLLEQAEVPAFVLGEHLSGGVGELPVMGLVAVAVADSDVEAAAAALEQWRAAAPGAAGDIDPGLL